MFVCQIDEKKKMHMFDGLKIETGYEMIGNTIEYRHILFIESSPLFPLARLPMRQVVVQKNRPTAWVQKAIKGWPWPADRGKLPNCCGKLENLSAKSVIYCRCYN